MWTMVLNTVVSFRMHQHTPPPHRPLLQHVDDLQYYAGCNINCLKWKYCVGDAPGWTILEIKYQLAL